MFEQDPLKDMMGGSSDERMSMEGKPESLSAEVVGDRGEEEGSVVVAMALLLLCDLLMFSAAAAAAAAAVASASLLLSSFEE